MRIERGLESLAPFDAAVVTVGTFDGVHLGHRRIIQRTKQLGRQHAAATVVVTFDPHPKSVLTGQEIPLLSTVEERAGGFSRLGVDCMVVLPFTEEFSKMEADAFVREMLVRKLGMTHMVVGHDHGFGRGRDGGREMLDDLGKELQFEIFEVPAQAVGGSVVSSSRIRELLGEEGDIRRAAEMLGRSYSFTGEVVPGQSRGRSIGFPTANLLPLHPLKLIPRRGVYAVEVYRRSAKKTYGGMLNVGRRPTFSLSTDEHIEVHLFDFRENLYGERLVVRFADRIREEKRFSSISDLREQLVRDQEESRRVLQKIYGRTTRS